MVTIALMLCFSFLPLNINTALAEQETKGRTTDPNLVEDVSQRLLAAASSNPGEYMSKYVWPPSFQVESVSDVNAAASIKWTGEPGARKPAVDKAGRYFSRVVVTQPFMTDLIQGEADRLAFVLGHELSHIILGHVLPASLSHTAQTEALSMVFTAEQEHDADLMGVKLALAAGYSIQGTREVWLRIMSDEFLSKHRGWDYTSFEGVGHYHPGWTDRLALIDKEKAELWKSMSAFENGVLFLSVQQYAPAVESFERVVADDAFPASYEAWANLGYARLMLYFDAFDEKDLAGYDLGNIVTGSFYFRPETMRSQVRGVNDKLWKSAVQALEKALELNSHLSLARANLGVAYLLSPTGKDSRNAIRYLGDAVATIDLDSNVSDYNYASVLINSAVALMAGGQDEKARACLEEAGRKEWIDRLFPAIRYNRALLLSHSPYAEQRHQAATLLRSYLDVVSTSSIWWDLGYQHYTRLSKELGLSVESKSEFERVTHRKDRLRPVTSVEMSKGFIVTLSDPLDVVRKKLGPAVPVPVAAGTNIVRLTYPKEKVELLAGRRVIAIFLHGDGAPAIQIRSAETGSGVSLLRVGMNAEDVEKILVSKPQRGSLFNNAATYDFYPAVGLALRFTKNKVVEMVITQVTVEGS